MSNEIKQLADPSDDRPQEILVSKDKPVLDLTKQYYLMTVKDMKRDALCTILDTNHPKAIVFCHTKHKVDQLTKKLRGYNYPVGAIHGDVTQSGREKVIRSFKDRSHQCSRSHELAAGDGHRGRRLVINYDAPNDPDTYVHRIRKDRKGRSGGHCGLVLGSRRSVRWSRRSNTGPASPSIRWT